MPETNEDPSPDLGGVPSEVSQFDVGDEKEKDEKQTVRGSGGSRNRGKKRGTGIRMTSFGLVAGVEVGWERGPVPGQWGVSFFFLIKNA